MLDKINLNIVSLYINKKYYPHFAIILFFAIIHCFIKINHGDDVLFSTIKDNMSWSEYYIMRYNTWSPRFIIETFVIKSIDNIWLWRICDTLSYLLMYIGLRSIINCKDKGSWFLALLIMCYPVRDMGTAGWIATSVNYNWPLTAVIISAYYLKKSFYANLKIYQYVILTLSVLFGSNHEQSGLLIFALLSFCVYLFLVNKKKVGLSLILPLCINVISLIFIFSAPGNFIRFYSEVETWFPGFTQLSFIDKIYIGLMRIDRVMIALPNYIALIFTITIAVCTQKRFKSTGLIIVGYIPLFLILAHLLIVRYDYSGFFNRHFYVPDFIYEIQEYHSKSFFPLFTLAAFFLSAFVIILRLPLKKDHRISYGLLLVGILCAGICSQMTLSMSPTVYASENRTFIYMYFSIISVCAFLYSRLNIKSNVPIIFAAFLALMQFAWMIKLCLSDNFY